MKTGRVIRKPFADVIWSDGTFKIDNKCRINKLKTGNEKVEERKKNNESEEL